MSAFCVCATVGAARRGPDGPSEVELTVIGLGHDVTRYDSRALPTADTEQVGRVILQRLAGVFDEDRGADTRVKSRRAA